MVPEDLLAAFGDLMPPAFHRPGPSYVSEHSMFTAENKQNILGLKLSSCGCVSEHTGHTAAACFETQGSLIASAAPSLIHLLMWSIATQSQTAAPNYRAVARHRSPVVTCVAASQQYLSQSSAGGEETPGRRTPWRLDAADKVDSICLLSPEVPIEGETRALEPVVNPERSM